jgi:hypothetical protein
VQYADLVLEIADVVEKRRRDNPGEKPIKALDEEVTRACHHLSGDETEMVRGEVQTVLLNRVVERGLNRPRSSFRPRTNSRRPIPEGWMERFERIHEQT